jgi:drug/metabolite transporter (DMT)-like permease
MLAAQMTGAFVVDWVVENEVPTVGVIAGAVLILGAVVIVGRQVAPGGSRPAAASS